MITRADFEAYDKANPKIWPLFEQYALEAARAGVKVGAKAVWERLRWESRIKTPGDDFAAFNNSFVAYYSRKFIEAHPGYGSIFVTRESQADKEPAPTTFQTAGGPPLDTSFGAPTRVK